MLRRLLLGSMGWPKHGMEDYVPDRPLDQGLAAGVKLRWILLLCKRSVGQMQLTIKIETFGLKCTVDWSTICFDFQFVEKLASKCRN